MRELKCPKCSRDFVRRVSRRDVIERLLGLFSVYPYKCQLCGERFRSLQRRYVRVEEDRREYDRMEARFPVSFSAAELSGDGVMLNFSTAGGNFSTTAQISPGAILRLQLHVAPDLVPITVEAALVQYVSMATVGVEFLRLQESERGRLQLLVQGMLIGRGVNPSA